MVGALLNEVREYLDTLVSMLPGQTGALVRARHYAWRLARLGPGARIGVGFRALSPENITIGAHFTTLANCTLSATAGGRVEIADDVSLAANVVLDAGAGGLIRVGNGSGIAHNGVLRSSAHNYADSERPFKSQGHTPGTIIVDDDVWVAAGVILLPGTHLRRGCVVASGSVVSGTVQAFSVVAGNPARVIGVRGPQKVSVP